MTKPKENTNEEAESHTNDLIVKIEDNIAKIATCKNSLSRIPETKTGKHKLHEEDQNAYAKEKPSDKTLIERYTDISNIRTTDLRKWFVLVAAFSNYAIALGFLFNLPIMYVEWLQEFKKSNSETALVQSICLGTFHISGLISGMAIAKYGCRKCGILGGIISTLGLVASFFANSIPFLCISVGVSGIGFCFCYVSATTSVEIHFNGRLKMIALAFVVFGSGVGMTLYPILLTVLLAEYGWRGTLLIVAGIMLNLVVNASIFQHQAETRKADIEIVVEENKNTPFYSNQKQSNTDISQCVDDVSKKTVVTTETRSLHIQHLNDKMSHTKRSKCLKDILKALILNKTFLIFIFSLATGATSFNSVAIFFIDYYQSKGISNANAIRIFMYMNIVITISQLFPGLLKQLPHVSSVFLPVLSISLGCISTAAFPFIGPSYGLNLMVACVFGFGFGSFITAITVTTVKLIPQESYSVGFGICLVSIGIFLVISGPIAGYIRDTTGNYDVSFLSASAVLFISCISFFITMVYRHHIQNRSNGQSQTVIQTKFRTLSVSNCYPNQIQDTCK